MAFGNVINVSLELLLFLIRSLHHFFWPCYNRSNVAVLKRSGVSLYGLQAFCHNNNCNNFIVFFNFYNCCICDRWEFITYGFKISSINSLFAFYPPFLLCIIFLLLFLLCSTHYCSTSNKVATLECIPLWIWRTII